MNRKEVLALVTENCKRLRSSDMSFSSIYEVMFRFSDNVLGEWNDGYRIHTCTYGEAKKQIEQVAAAIYARIGATHQYVALEMENCMEWIIAFWAILRSGNKPYLVNCRHPKALAERICNSIKIAYVIGKEQTQLSAEFIDFSTLTGGGDFEAEFENEIALSTSATSLNGVVCFYSGKELSNQLLNTESILQENNRISMFYHGELKNLAFLPFYHIFGLIAVYFWFTFFGRTIVFLRDYAPDTILRTVRKHEVTHIFGVPMLWHTIEKEVLKQLKKQGQATEKKFYKGLHICTAIQNMFPYWGSRLAKKIMHEVTEQIFGPSVLFCISGGSYLKDSTLYMFNGMGYALHNGYGMSEIGITSVELRKRPKDRNHNSIGHPMKSVKYRISDTGTLLVCGNSLCHSIMINGEYQKKEDWFDTGDVMTCQDGYYFIQGRMGDVVIGDNGENINPDVIEQCFSIPEAGAFTVLGLKDGSQATESLAMIVNINPYLPIRRIDAIKQQIYRQNEALPVTTQVREFYFTYDELAPATAIKVGRKYVLRGLQNGSIHLIPFADIAQAVSSTTEEINPQLIARVQQIVAKGLGLEPKQIQENTHLLNDLGISSLEYFAVLTELADEFQLSVSDSPETYGYTVCEIAKYIEEHIC